MQPAQSESIRQSLDKACRLVKPRRAALEAFTEGLAKLLVMPGNYESQEQAQALLLAVLPASCFADEDGQAPESSSPVCYAQVPGLREGFADTGLPEPPANRITGDTGLREALLAVQHGLCLMLSAAPASPPAGTAPDSQIARLVYQLYELSPAEIAALGQASE